MNESPVSCQDNELNNSSGEEFLSFANDPLSVTSRTAARFGISAEQFTNWRWQMRRQIREGKDVAGILELSLEEGNGFSSLGTLFNAGVTPYYLGLMSHGDNQESATCPIRRQVLPRSEELSDSLGRKDPLEESNHSPVKEVVQVYPDRVAFCVAQLCPVYCRYCFRKRRDDEEGLHYNRKIVDQGIAYIASNPAIRDVLITGGDPFIASDASIISLVEKIRAISHVEIIRFGTRTPVTLPYRVTRQLAAALARFHPIWVNTHFNCPEELTPEAKMAVENLVNAGIPVGNQSVLLKGVNDSTERLLALSRGLLKMRARPYYLFHPHRIEGTEHLRISVRKGLEIVKGMRGNITGFGIPTYALDTPSGKIPLAHNFVLGQDGEDLIFEDIRGEIWREPGVW